MLWLSFNFLVPFKEPYTFLDKKYSNLIGIKGFFIELLARYNKMF
jgi:hypothetical protein